MNSSCFYRVCLSRLSENWAHQIGGEERLEVEEQPSTGNLLQPAPAGFLGLLMVLGVREVLVLFSANTVELRVDMQKLFSLQF